jgi:hypothetical protein
MSELITKADYIKKYGPTNEEYPYFYIRDGRKLGLDISTEESQTCINRVLGESNPIVFRRKRTPDTLELSYVQDCLDNNYHFVDGKLVKKPV